MAATDNVNTTQAPANRTYDAGQVKSALEKEKNVKEAQFQLAYDLSHMSSSDFNKVYEQVQSNIKDWNKTHIGPDALGEMQLFDSKGSTVTDASKAAGIKFENSDTAKTGQAAALQSGLNNLELSSTHQETKGDTTTTYDNDGKRLAIDKKNADGSVSHQEFDPKTGNVTSTDTAYKDGTREHAEMKYDPTTGKRISLEVQDRHGNSDYVQYDPATGNPEYRCRTSKDGSTEETAYDPSSGHIQSVVYKNPDGETVETTKYDPITQNPVSHYKKTDDGEQLEEYDPNTGQLKTRTKTTDAGTEKEEYDPSTGHLKSLDKKNADGSSEHTDYDPITRHPVSYQKKDEDGNVIEEKKFDPGTGEPINADADDQGIRAGKVPQAGGQTPQGPAGGQTGNQIPSGFPSLTF